MVIGVDRISKVGVLGARVAMFGGSGYEVLFIYRNRLHYTTENNCQKVGVPDTMTLKKWGARAPRQAGTNGNYTYGYGVCRHL
jgi:hypothetical protein